MLKQDKCIQKIAELDAELKRLRACIVDVSLEMEVWQNELDTIDKSVNEFPFGKKKRGAQIIYILNNLFQRAVTMNSLETKHSELIGEHQKLGNVMRRLKDEGIVVSIRYNKQNTATFWGLTKWYNGDDFKEEFQPLGSELPLKVLIKEKI